MDNTIKMVKTVERIILKQAEWANNPLCANEECQELNTILKKLSDMLKDKLKPMTEIIEYITPEIPRWKMELEKELEDECVKLCNHANEIIDNIEQKGN